jgi:2'-hydroxyisoflavone reductase
MKVLVLGGTRFAGRAIVEALASGIHDVTCLHRGKTRCELPPGVCEVFGDRNAALPLDLNSHWNAVIDVSGQLPEQLERSCELETDWYLFVSTLSVYTDLSKLGVDEEAPTIEAFDPSDEAAAYGGNKASCERIVLRQFGKRATIVRPGIIVGRWDYTGRFTYWPRRALQGGPFIVPAPRTRPVQFVDVDDLAAFAVRAVAQRRGGTYNVVGPRDAFSMGALIDGCVAAAAERGVCAEPIVLDGDRLIAKGVEPWTDLPMWVADPSYAGLFSASNARAIDAGLEFRPPTQTLRSLIDWIGMPEAVVAARPGLSREREAQILDELQNS